MQVHDSPLQAVRLEAIAIEVILTVEIPHLPDSDCHWHVMSLLASNGNRLPFFQPQGLHKVG